MRPRPTLLTYYAVSVQGLADWNVDPSQVIPWVDHLESLGIKTKQLFGQWVHTYPDSIGKGGVEGYLDVDLAQEELDGVKASAEILRKTYAEIG